MNRKKPVPAGVLAVVGVPVPSGFLVVSPALAVVTLLGVVVVVVAVVLVVVVVGGGVALGVFTGQPGGTANWTMWKQGGDWVGKSGWCRSRRSR